jgi:hypothetical protein
VSWGEKWGILNWKEQFYGLEMLIEVLSDPFTDLCPLGLSQIHPGVVKI